MLRCGEHTRELRGSDRETTSNRMQLLAAIEGLRTLKVSCPPSERLSILKERNNAVPYEMETNGWVRADGEPVLNQDLRDQLDRIAQKHEIQWEP